MRSPNNPRLTRFSEPLRTLEDEELDSGDDEGRHDRMPSEQYDQETQNVVIQESSMSRQPLPEPTDGEVCICDASDLKRLLTRLDVPD